MHRWHGGQALQQIRVVADGNGRIRDRTDVLRLQRHARPTRGVRKSSSAASRPLFCVGATFRAAAFHSEACVPPACVRSWMRWHAWQRVQVG